MSKNKGKIAVLVGGLAILLGTLPVWPVPAAEKAPGAETAEAAILAKLDEAATIEFVEEPLSSCVQFLKDYHQIEIQIDERALEDVGIGPDEPVTLSVKGVSLRSALNLTLRKIGLDWTIANEVLLITSPEEGQRNLVTRAYDMADLITVRDGKGELWRDFDSMIELITSTIEPEQWEEVGGAGSIEPFELRGAGGLVIRHTPKVHCQVDQLLQELTMMASKRGDDVYPTREPKDVSGTIAAGGEMGGAAKPE